MATSERCKICSDYWPTADGEIVTAIHGARGCVVYIERRSGDVEAHAVQDDGAGTLFCTFGDDENDAAKDLLKEVSALRAGLAACREELAEVMEQLDRELAISIEHAQEIIDQTSDLATARKERDAALAEIEQMRSQESWLLVKRRDSDLAEALADVERLKAALNTATLEDQMLDALDRGEDYDDQREEG